MPTNFKGSFRCVVPFKKKSETCSWPRHCTGDALREVVRVMVMLAKRDPVNHYVYAQPKAIQEMCTGKYRKGKKKNVPLSLSTVEKCLQLLEGFHIVSHELAHSPDNSDHRKGRVVTPHNKLCHCYPKACSYVGIDGGSGIWLRDGDKAVSVADEFADIGDVAALVQNSVAIQNEFRPDSEPIQNEFRPDSGAGTVLGMVSGMVTKATTNLKSNEIVEPPAKVPEAFPEENLADPCKPPEIPKPPQPLEPAKSGKRRSGGGLVKNLAAMWWKENKSATEVLTSQKQQALAELEKAHGQQRVEQVFAVMMKEPSKFKTETTHPLTQLINGFDVYAAIADAKMKYANDAEKLKSEMVRIVKHGSRNVRVNQLGSPDFLESLTPEQRELLRRCKETYWLVLTADEEAELEALYEWHTRYHGL